jgi:hypothetical protein
LNIAIAADDELLKGIKEDYMEDFQVVVPFFPTLSLDYSKIVVYTEENLSVYFTGEAAFPISFYLKREQFFRLSEEEVTALRHSEESGDRYYAEMDCTLPIRGMLGIHIPLQKRMDELKASDFEVSVEEVY